MRLTTLSRSVLYEPEKKKKWKDNMELGQTSGMRDMDTRGALEFSCVNSSLTFLRLAHHFLKFSPFYLRPPLCFSCCIVRLMYSIQYEDKRTSAYAEA